MDLREVAVDLGANSFLASVIVRRTLQQPSGDLGRPSRAKTAERVIAWLRGRYV